MPHLCASDLFAAARRGEALDLAMQEMDETNKFKRECLSCKNILISLKPKSLFAIEETFYSLCLTLYSVFFNISMQTIRNA